MISHFAKRCRTVHFDLIFFETLYELGDRIKGVAEFSELGLRHDFAAAVCEQHSRCHSHSEQTVLVVCVVQRANEAENYSVCSLPLAVALTTRS